MWWACGYRREEHELGNVGTVAYFFASVPFGIIGAILGVRLSLKISDTAIFFFIGGVLFLVGCVLSIQSAVQSDD